jgi:hypothetical protein
MLDGSGSMQVVINKATLFAAVLYKSQDADCVIYSNEAYAHTFNPTDSVTSIAQQMHAACPMGGTCIHAAFETAVRPYERIMILSDMQSWVRDDGCPIAYNSYAQRVGMRPKLYSWDLAGYGTMEFPERNVYALAGFSEKVFDTMAMLEEDREALVNSIEAVTF